MIRDLFQEGPQPPSTADVTREELRAIRNQPAQKRRTVVSRKRVNRQFTRPSAPGPTVTLHGFDDLNEAMKIKEILQENGCTTAVDVSPGEFEYRVLVDGKDPYQFTVSVPVNLDLQKAREIVTEAISASPTMVASIIQDIRRNPDYITFAEDLCSQILKAREYLFGEASTTFFNPVSQPTQGKTMENQTQSQVQDAEVKTETVNTDTSANATTPQDNAKTLSQTAEETTNKVVSTVAAFSRKHKTKIWVGLGLTILAAGGLMLYKHKSN